MQVNLSFDTEKDSVDEFRRLLEYVKQILAEKEGVKVSPIEQTNNNPGLNSSQGNPKPAEAPKLRTAGGGRIVPYQDLSNQLFSLCSKKKGF